MIADPIGAVTTQHGDEDPELPAGVFDAHAGYPLSAFALGERAEQDLAALVKLNPAYADREARDDALRPRGARAGRPSSAPRMVSARGHSALIVGQEVADQLVGDRLKQALKDERARARARRETAAAEPRTATGRARVAPAETRGAGAGAPARGARGGVAGARGGGGVQSGARDRGGQDVRQGRTRRARPAGPDRGRLQGRPRGARRARRPLRLPGLARRRRPTGKRTKTVYLERYEAAAKAHEYLQGATSPAEIAGRCLALVVMAVVADETCVARSNRSMVSLHDYQPASYEIPGRRRSGLPWRRRVVELVEDLAIDALPEHLTRALRERPPERARRTRRRARAAEAAATEREAPVQHPAAAAA